MLRKVLFIFIALLSSIGLFAQGGTISGNVVDKNSGEPLVGATVTHVASGKKVITDFDGNFSINGVIPGTTALKISYISYQESSIEKISVNEDEPTELKIMLNRVQQYGGSKHLMAQLPESNSKS